jgi:hypothetical protein
MEWQFREVQATDKSLTSEQAAFMARGRSRRRIAPISAGEIAPFISGSHRAKPLEHAHERSFMGMFISRRNSWGCSQGNSADTTQVSKTESHRIFESVAKSAAETNVCTPNFE